jgi:hypothetical protein
MRGGRMTASSPYVGAPVASRPVARELLSEWLGYLRNQTKKTGRVKLDVIKDDLSSFFDLDVQSHQFMPQLKYLRGHR